MAELTDLTIQQALEKLRAREFSAVELTRAYLDRIEALEPTLQAYITVTADYALQAAQRADARLAANEQGALLGIPLAVKDVFSTKGIETSCASDVLKGYIPIFSATIIEKLEAAGMVILGKTNMDEFAMGSSTESSAYGITRNPWNLDYVPGGSSGGSAAAVAAHTAAAALASDTGGSIRQPGAYCGIAALKPSYGRVSRYGLIAFGSSLDSPGVMAQTVTDVALLMNVMAGHDPLDSNTVTTPVPDYTQSLTANIRGMKIGIPQEYFIEGIDPAVEAAVRAAISQLEALGAELIEISMPHTDYSLPTYYMLATAEASSNLARFDGIRYGQRVETDDMWSTYKATRGQFGPEVKRRIMMGTYALSAGYYDAYYGKAQAVRTLIKQDFDRAFDQVDAIVTPTAPTAAFKIGENTDDPLKMYLQDIFTLPASLAGMAALNIPCGFNENRLPIGLQIITPAQDEATALRLGHAYEQATEWHTYRPE